MSSWMLLPRIGIEYLNLQIRFGMSKVEVQNIVGDSCIHLNSDVAKTNCKMRFEYTQSHELELIEFFGGSLLLEDIELFNTTTTKLSKLFSKDGYELFYPTSNDLGQICPQMCIGVMSSKDSGGTTTKIRCITIFKSNEQINFPFF